MTVTTEQAWVPAMHRDYPGQWVVRDGVTVGLFYHVDHEDGSQTWYAIRRPEETWHRFGDRGWAKAWAASGVQP